MKNFEKVCYFDNCNRPPMICILLNGSVHLKFCLFHADKTDSITKEKRRFVASFFDFFKNLPTKV